MAQHRPPNFGRRRKETTTGTGEGAPRLAVRAVNSFGAAVVDTALGQRLTRDVSVRDIRSELGDTEISRIAERIGLRPPSGRTIRRWTSDDRIPDAHLAEVLDRHRFISAQGGVRTLAQALGRSPSSVRRWMNGQQETFRGDANDKLDAARTTERRRRERDRSGPLSRWMRQRLIDAQLMTRAGRIKDATISLEALVEHRVAGEHGYSQTRTRSLNFVPGTETALGAEDSLALAKCIALEDHAGAVSILERHATLQYAASGFDRYTDDEGLHLIDIHSISIRWH